MRTKWLKELLLIFIVCSMGLPSDAEVAYFNLAVKQKPISGRDVKDNDQSHIIDPLKFINVDERSIDDIIAYIEQVGTRPLNTISRQLLRTKFGAVLRQTNEVFDFISSKNKTTPEICYESADILSDILKRNGYRHIKNTAVRITDDMYYTHNYVTIELNGVEFVFDLLNNLFSENGTRVVLIPRAVVDKPGLYEDFSATYTEGYRWPVAVKIEIDRSGTLSNVRYFTLTAENKQVVSVKNPKLVSRNAILGDMNKFFGSFAVLGMGDFGERAVEVRLENGSNEVKLLILDKVEMLTAIMRHDAQELGKATIDADKNESLVIDNGKQQISYNNSKGTYKIAGGINVSNLFPANVQSDHIREYPAERKLAKILKLSDAEQEQWVDYYNSLFDQSEDEGVLRSA
jgi:hypothetical protein